MTSFTASRLSATAALLCATAPAALAQTADPDAGGITLAPIVVEGAAEAASAAGHAFSPRNMTLAPAMDGGGLLASTPGVTAGRMGGHAQDIVIRGQQGNQLNIIDAGGVTYGACPNRMDPPTSTAAFSRADRVVVERGYASVRNGPGGSGGTVRLERLAPAFDDGTPMTGDLTVGGASNGRGVEAAGRLAIDLGRGVYAEGSAAFKDADNYDDGDGREVRGAFTQKSAGATFGYKTEGAELAFDIENDRAEDVLFAGAGMDSPLVDTWVYRLRGGVDVDQGPLTRLEGTLFLSTVDHVMDNYSLRPSGMMGMRAPTSSDTWGGKLEGALDFGATAAWIGIDHQSNNRMALGFMGPIAVVEAGDLGDAITLSWPDVTTAQTGFYVQTETDLRHDARMRLGLRYDRVEARADDAAGKPGYTATVPNVYYQSVYGVDFNEARTENNVGGLMRFEHDLSPGAMIFAGLSRAVRTADANERAMARGMMGVPTWVGNPDIAPEKHHQFDLGLELTAADWSVNAAVYYDRVEDYILLDQFTTPGLTQYRNVSADLSGLELSGAWTRGGFALSGDLTFTYGENRTDGRALAQIPPLQGRITASYGQDDWRAGARVNWAMEQTRIDPARDPGRTPGYATLDLFGTYALSKTVDVAAGVTNLFDETYANHLSRTNVFDAAVTQVNEPGRSFYVKVQARF